MKFAHKCEKLKDSESIPRFLQTLEKSFALSDITSSKEKFRVLHFLIPPSVSAELPKDFNKLGEQATEPYQKALEELKKYTRITLSVAPSKADYSSPGSATTKRPASTTSGRSS